MNNQGLITLLIRFTLGPIFLAYGIHKLGGYSITAKRIGAGFVETWLPMWLVQPVALAIPIWELLVGILLILGLFYRISLIATSIFIAILTFGLAIQGNAEVVGRNLIFVVTLAIAFHNSDDNPYSLDTLRKPKKIRKS